MNPANTVRVSGTTRQINTSRRLRALSLVMMTAAWVAVACSGGDATIPLSPGGGDGGFDFGSGSGGGDVLDEDSACATASDEAKLVPVNMYIMFDKSGSMTGTKWAQTTQAMETFFSAKESAGLRVALRFFPDDGCPDGGCNGASCMQPTVALGELTNLSAPTDLQEQALLQALADGIPMGGTPMHPALGGAVMWAQNHVASAPLDKAVVVLVTDGEPEDCNTSEQAIIDVAAHGFSGSGVLTFAVGLEGSNASLLDGIAAAGGTTEAVFVDTDDAQQQFLDALTVIKESAVACEFQMPQGTSDSPIDPNKVNVIYTPGDGGEDVIVGQVAGESACTADAGWYYDNPNAPTKIVFCPSTCAALQSDLEAHVEILLGCTTVPA